ncbi:unnamed protein product [Mytilus coruscus]|uniref:Fucolectin tachylectin-4 pentraxin-1 domain-containing protein n=1 Tax=Mytilus coruscus TaxID=42192 RepID=A0A6J8AUF7_MYTCO|nr:unnamed protein product [Mytilus coruscus]
MQTIELFFRNNLNKIYPYKRSTLEKSRQDSIPPNTSLAERGPQLGNDGNIDTIGTNSVCAHTGFDSEYFWWTVNLEKEFIIEKVKIYGRTDCCNSRNLALYKVSRQSSTWNEAVESYGPQIGNDGRTDYDNFPSGFVTQTDSNSDVTPWWGVDLDEVFVINKVIIYNRKDCCNDLQCPCSCDYKRQLKFMASNDLPNYTMKQWREILQPRIKELQRELKLDRKTMSKSKRKISSAGDNRGSARNLGIIGVTILVSVFSLIVLDDLLAFLRYVQQIRRVCGV